MSVMLRQLRQHWPEWLAALMGSLWLTFFPLWQDGSFSRITKAKLNGMHLLSCIMVGMLLLALLLLLFSHRQTLLRLHPCQLLALGYFLWVALSTWQGRLTNQLNANGDRAVWLGALRHEGLQTQLFYALIFLCMSFLRPRLDILVHLAAGALILLFAVVLLQYAGHNPLGLFPSGLSIRTNYEFQGTIGNIDMVSGYLCLAVPLMLGSFVWLKRPYPLLLFAGMCGVMEQLMIEVQSGLIALAAGLGILMILLLRKPALRTRILTVYGAVLLLVSIRLMLALPWLDGTENIIFPYEPSLAKCLLILAALACWCAAWFLRRHPGQALSGRFTALLVLALLLTALVLLLCLPLSPAAGGLWEIQQVLLGNIQDSFGSYRLGVWRYTLDFSRNNPIFGTGPDTFLYALKHYQAANFIQLPETFDNPHNEYLAILSNNGLPALLLYLALMATLIISCIRSHRRECKILSGSVILFLIQGFFSFSICLVTPMFWAICGMACAWSAPERSSSTPTQKGC